MVKGLEALQALHALTAHSPPRRIQLIVASGTMSLFPSSGVFAYSITTLHISGPVKTTCLRFPDDLMFPAVHTLILTGQMDETPFPWNRFSALRSLRLRYCWSLGIHDVGLPDIPLHMFEEPFVGLETLTMEHVYMQHTNFQYILRSAAKTLHTLSLVNVITGTGHYSHFNWHTEPQQWNCLSAVHTLTLGGYNSLMTITRPDLLPNNLRTLIVHDREDAYSYWYLYYMGIARWNEVEAVAQLLNMRIRNHLPNLENIRLSGPDTHWTAWSATVSEVCAQQGISFEWEIFPGK